MKGAETAGVMLPRPLDSYGDAATASLVELLLARAKAEPLNVAALAIFIAAILHTFFAAKIRHLAHRLEENNAAKRGMVSEAADGSSKTFLSETLHFFGEVEAIFGIWAVVLALVITLMKGWPSVVSYIGEHVSYTEPIFVVVIMAIAATRPVTTFAEACLRRVANLGGGTPAAWWLSILILAPLLGSFITEPAAMTIAALLLGRQLYELNPSVRFRYATLGLLFVNVSVGGTLTHFAAPPVIMVARPWGWGFGHMLAGFGWRAVVGVTIATLCYAWVFRKELAELKTRQKRNDAGSVERASVPFWIVAVHVGFLAFTVWQAHHPALCVGGFLFFIAFTQATAPHQDDLDLRPPVLVGFFLAGLVVHGGLQGWWIQPLLSRLGEVPLFLTAVGLTAFNDNAAITYLATLVPSFTDLLKHAVVAGAVVGGGLTVIANAPNPAGQAILGRYFKDGVAPLGLLAAAAWPTVVMGLCLMLL